MARRIWRELCNGRLKLWKGRSCERSWPGETSLPEIHSIQQLHTEHQMFRDTAIEAYVRKAGFNKGFVIVSYDWVSRIIAHEVGTCEEKMREKFLRSSQLENEWQRRFLFVESNGLVHDKDQIEWEV